LSASHSHVHQGTERQLKLAFALTGTYLVAELIGAFFLNSLALLSDAAHMGTDTAALGIALIAARVARRPADAQRSYGYHRVEVLAAVVNAVMLFLVAVYIMIEAVKRFGAPAAPNSVGMILVAAGGLVVNLISMRLLQSDSKLNLNIRGAYLEVWSDMLGSVGVIIAAIVIYFTGWLWVDPAIAVAIALWVLPRTWTMLKESLNVLLEGLPKGMNLSVVEREIKAIAGVVDVHHIHVWALSSAKPSLTAHILHTPDSKAHEVIAQVNEMLSIRFQIYHSTLQCEPSSTGEFACQLDSRPSSGESKCIQ
jgi:cobalt-zinc-cadmium efflux system protein